LFRRKLPERVARPAPTGSFLAPRLKKIANTYDFWVAAAGMVAKKYNTGVSVYREELCAPFLPEESAGHRALVSPALGGTNAMPGPRDFTKAAAICYTAITRAMVARVGELLAAGRGVFVIARDTSHAGELAALLARVAGPAGVFVVGNGRALHHTDDAVAAGAPDYLVVVAPQSYSAGYTLTRLNAVVTCVYPSNQATRDQLEGRVNRLTQARKDIPFVVVHAGVLTHVMRHHASARNLQAALAKLAGEIGTL
jgi:hypothetical protein